MTDLLVTAFASQGVLGLACIILAKACWQLQSQVKSVQDDRVADAKAVTETVLKLVGEQHSAISELTSVIVDLRNSLEE